MKEGREGGRREGSRRNPVLPRGKYVEAFTKTPRDASKTLDVQKQQL